MSHCRHHCLYDQCEKEAEGKPSALLQMCEPSFWLSMAQTMIGSVPSSTARHDT